MHFLTYYFWIGSSVLLLTVIILMVLRRAHRHYPAFFTYCIFEVIRCVVLLLMYLVFKVSVHGYEIAVASTLAISTGLKFAVLYQIGESLLTSRARRAATLRPLLRWAVAVLLLAAVAASATQIRSGVQNVQNVFLSLELLWSVIICGMVLALFAVGPREFWESYGTGIAVGFGIFAAVNLATSAFRADTGAGGNNTVNVIQMGAYHVCVAVWLIYLLRPNRRSPPGGAGLQKD